MCGIKLLTRLDLAENDQGPYAMPPGPKRRVSCQPPPGSLTILTWED